MRVFFGGPAHSEFRLLRFSELLQTTAKNIVVDSTQYVYFIWMSDDKDHSAPFSDSETDSRLCELLDAERNGDFVSATNRLVVPRVGTISPWSSKATDIAHNCGLTHIDRIERGIIWRFISNANRSNTAGSNTEIDPKAIIGAEQIIHDRMTETVLNELDAAENLQYLQTPKQLDHVPLMSNGLEAIENANKNLGLALADDEIEYLHDRYSALNRDPTDVELMMFAQANSEHCRHKIFNASWTVDGIAKDHSLFAMIKHTHSCAPNQVLSAYSDNSAVTTGYPGRRFFPDPNSFEYQHVDERIDILMKVETHNHPTAISPYPGASTGSGGEIRDEGATGRGAKPKAGLTGFSVSHLRIPEKIQPWEIDRPLNPRLASAFEIMRDGPIGAASFNNEFGRPALCGYFRSFESDYGQGLTWGYDKPIMLAGGMGNIRTQHIAKHDIDDDTHIIVLGGPAMLIGLGGGAASSMGAGDSRSDLDFASVQRDNPEMERRCQEVINRCWAMGDSNPIESIHDVGAGGLSNAIPEILHDSQRGGSIELRKIPNADASMSPLEIWCNEAQERYVVAVATANLALFERICTRERCPFAVLGTANLEEVLLVHDADHDTAVIDLPMDVIFGKPPKMHRNAVSQQAHERALDVNELALDVAMERVLSHPSVADKRFLITIGDRTVGGLTVRDQMVGPWQVPVADCAVTMSGFGTITGEAMAIGERTPLALDNGPASGRMAIGEMLTNICAARILRIEDIVVSANWMAAAGTEGEDAKLFETVKAVGLSLCPELGIVIPVGKDSMSMKAQWTANTKTHSTVSPVSLIASGFAPVAEVDKTLDPQLKDLDEPSTLFLFDLGGGRHRMGGSILAEVFSQHACETPDLDEPQLMRDFFTAIQILNDTGYLIAYHDRADGGLFTTISEMAFAARQGVDIDVSHMNGELLALLFNEELGAVVQVADANISSFRSYIEQFPDLARHCHPIGKPNTDRKLRIRDESRTTDSASVFEGCLFDLLASWSSTTLAMQALRDNPACAAMEAEAIADQNDPGLSVKHSPPPAVDRITPNLSRPRIAVLREQGVNGQIEMAAAFDRAGFTSVDVHMSDLIAGDVTLDNFNGLVACGGFSYGDVLGAGGGWAKSIRYNTSITDAFGRFFKRDSTFALGVCNGCQMLAHLSELIPEAENWPHFSRNESEQFEARLIMVSVESSPSIFLKDMTGAKIPIVVAHGEGRAVNDNPTNVCMRYVDNHGNQTQAYPYNPNGSINAVAGVTSNDGRVTIMMPHPERVFLSSQFSWLPRHWRNEDGPWMQMFDNARAWLD